MSRRDRFFLHLLSPALLSLGCIAALADPAAAEPTFDCSRAAKPIEVLICSDPDLWHVENDTFAAWQQAKAALGASGRQQLYANQRAWIAQYPERCGLPGHGRLTPTMHGNARDCVVRSLRQRTAALNAIASGNHALLGEAFPDPVHVGQQLAAQRDTAPMQVAGAFAEPTRILEDDAARALAALQAARGQLRDGFETAPQGEPDLEAQALAEQEALAQQEAALADELRQLALLAPTLVEEDWTELATLVPEQPADEGGFASDAGRESQLAALLEHAIEGEPAPAEIEVAAVEPAAPLPAATDPAISAVARSVPAEPAPAPQPAPSVVPAASAVPESGTSATCDCATIACASLEPGEAQLVGTVLGKGGAEGKPGYFVLALDEPFCADGKTHQAVQFNKDRTFFYTHENRRLKVSGTLLPKYARTHQTDLVLNVEAATEAAN